MLPRRVPDECKERGLQKSARIKPQVSCLWRWRTILETVHTSILNAKVNKSSVIEIQRAGKKALAKKNRYSLKFDDLCCCCLGLVRVYIWGQNGQYSPGVHPGSRMAIPQTIRWNPFKGNFSIPLKFNHYCHPGTSNEEIRQQDTLLDSGPCGRFHHYRNRSRRRKPIHLEAS